VPFTLDFTSDFYSKPQVLHFHQTLRCDRSLTVSGDKGKLRSDHSPASSGCIVAKSLMCCSTGRLCRAGAKQRQDAERRRENGYHLFHVFLQHICVISATRGTSSKPPSERPVTHIFYCPFRRLLFSLSNSGLPTAEGFPVPEDQDIR
jgi:hypothetical protein